MDLHRYAHPQTLVKVASKRRLNTLKMGEGGPAIVLMPGMGGSTLSWARVQDELSKLTTVISLDNAGFGFSDPGPLPRDTERTVADARAALNALNVPGPYVLAGHSAGSLDIQYWTSRYPDEVLGLVFVDPSTPHQHRRLFPDPKVGRAYQGAQMTGIRNAQRLAKAGEFTPHTPGYEVFHQNLERLPDAVNEARRRQNTSPQRFRTLISALTAFDGRAADQVVGARQGPHPLGDRPVIVLTATDAPPPPAEQGQVAAWRAMNAEIAALSTRGERRMIESDHNIQVTKPRPVIEAITEVWQAVR